MDYSYAKARLLENEDVKKEYERLKTIRCSKCKHYRRIYIHPWSEGIPETLKMSEKGFACLLPCDKDFIKSFNGESYTDDDLRVEIFINKDDSIGCENFEES